MTHHVLHPWKRTAMAGGVIAVSALALSACAPAGSGEVDGDYGFVIAEQDPDSAITVWVDASREPIARAFEDAHPDVPVNIETYDGGSGGSGSFQSRVALYDQAGEGWPDVVFSTQQNDAAWAAQESNGVQAFAAPLDQGWFDDEFLDGFTEGALSPMTVDDAVYGLRNDLAPVVLWVNQELFDEFGYEVPTTWEEYRELSDRVAEEHPGYILGSLGDSFEAPYVYYWSGEAPVFQTDGEEFSSDFSDPESEKVTELLDHMLENGTMSTESVFAAEFATENRDRLLAIPGPAWFAGALFENPDSLGYDPGTIGAAPALRWEDGDEVTGNVGGGVWYASSHSRNLDAAQEFLEFVISSEQAVELTSGLPAYESAAQTWLDQQASSGFYVGDFSEVLSSAASSVWQGWGYPSFSAETAYANIVIPAITAGEPVSSVVDEWQEEIRNQAQVQGYTVQ